MAQSVTLYLTTSSIDTDNFTIYHTSIDPGNILASSVPSTELANGWCTDVTSSAYIVSSNTTSCDSVVLVDTPAPPPPPTPTPTVPTPTPTVPTPTPTVPTPTPTVPTPTPTVPTPTPTVPTPTPTVPTPTPTPTVPTPTPTVPTPTPTVPTPTPTVPTPTPTVPTPTPTVPTPTPTVPTPTPTVPTPTPTVPTPTPTITPPGSQFYTHSPGKSAAAQVKCVFNGTGFQEQQGAQNLLKYITGLSSVTANTNYSLDTSYTNFDCYNPNSPYANRGQYRRGGSSVAKYFVDPSQTVVEINEVNSISGDLAANFLAYQNYRWEKT